MTRRARVDVRLSEVVHADSVMVIPISRREFALSRRMPARYKIAIGLCWLAILTACAPQTSSEVVRGALIVVGSGTQQSAMNAWRDGWIKTNNKVSVNYSPDGDAAGKKALFSSTAYVATTDSSLSEQDISDSKAACGPRGAFAVPTAITPVGVAYNLGDVKGIRIDAPTLASIFTGQITEWNDRRLKDLNPTINLPQREIVPFTSKEPSALTTASSSYLATYGNAAWPFTAGDKWPKGVSGKIENKNSDIPQKIDDTFGSIAFMDKSSLGNRFNAAILKFTSGFQKFTTDSVATAADSGQYMTSANGVTATLNHSIDPGYQLAAISYQSFCYQYANGPTTSLVKSWAEYILSEAGQRQSSINAGTVELNSATLAASRALVATMNPLGP